MNQAAPPMFFTKKRPDEGYSITPAPQPDETATLNKRQVVALESIAESLKVIAEGAS